MDGLSLREEADEAALHTLSLVEGVLLLAVEYVILFTGCVHGFSQQCLPLGSPGLFSIFILSGLEEISQRLSKAQIYHFLEANYYKLRHHLDILMVQK
jgi:hypothetical protein